MNPLQRWSTSTYHLQKGQPSTRTRMDNRPEDRRRQSRQRRLFSRANAVPRIRSILIPSNSPPAARRQANPVPWSSKGSRSPRIPPQNKPPGGIIHHSQELVHIPTHRRRRIHRALRDTRYTSPAAVRDSRGEVPRPVLLCYGIRGATGTTTNGRVLQQPRQHPTINIRIPNPFINRILHQALRNTPNPPNDET
jgi:ribosomal protein L35